MTIAVITWSLDGIAVIASCVAWRFAIQARRSVRRIHEIRGGGPQ